jgi:hypothetical protein
VVAGIGGGGVCDWGGGSGQEIVEVLRCGNWFVDSLKVRPFAFLEE